MKLITVLELMSSRSYKLYCDHPVFGMGNLWPSGHICPVSIELVLLFLLYQQAAHSSFIVNCATTGVVLCLSSVVISAVPADTRLSTWPRSVWVQNKRSMLVVTCCFSRLIAIPKTDHKTVAKFLFAVVFFRMFSVLGSTVVGFLWSGFRDSVSFWVWCGSFSHLILPRV